MLGAGLPIALLGGAVLASEAAFLEALAAIPFK
jgi:hypothetical protein